MVLQQQTPPGVPGPPRDSPDGEPGQGAFAGFMATYGAGNCAFVPGPVLHVMSNAASMHGVGKGVCAVVT